MGDVHFGLDSGGTLRPALLELRERADLLLIAGDLTRSGRLDEAAVLAREIKAMPIPVMAVLGNHDYHQDQDSEIRAVLESSGVTVLEGECAQIDVDGLTVGVAGGKGFGGGFAGACGTEFGEPEMKAFMSHTRLLAASLEEALSRLRTTVRIALTHYAPAHGTLVGERLEIYPFLGSYLLGEAIDRQGADLVIHGHSHRGTEKGVTPGGIHVRNVAQPVIRQSYRVYSLEPGAGRAVAHRAREEMVL